MTLDFTSTDWGFPSDYVTAEASYTKDGYTITFGASSSKGHKAMTKTVKKVTTQTGVIFGQKGATLSLPAFSFDVEKIEVVGIAGASGKVTQNIYVGETAVSTQTTGATGTNTYEIASGYQAAGNVYVIKITNGNNSQISAIKIYKKEGGSETVTVAPPPSLRKAVNSPLHSR